VLCSAMMLPENKLAFVKVGLVWQAPCPSLTSLSLDRFLFTCSTKRSVLALPENSRAYNLIVWYVFAQRRSNIGFCLFCTLLLNISWPMLCSCQFVWFCSNLGPCSAVFCACFCNRKAHALALPEARLCASALEAQA